MLFIRARFLDCTRRLEKETGEQIAPDIAEKVRKSFIDQSNYTFQIPKELIIPAPGAADKLAQLLFAMNWSIVRPRHGYFISSDNTVTALCLRPARAGPWLSKAKLGVTWPLTPQAILLMIWRGNAPKFGHRPGRRAATKSATCSPCRSVSLRSSSWRRMDRHGRSFAGSGPIASRIRH